VSNIFVPPSKSDLPSDAKNLSVVTGVINKTNNIPSLEDEMAAIVTPKVKKHQLLMNNDCSNAINKLTEKSSGFYCALNTKQKLISADFCLNF